MLSEPMRAFSEVIPNGWAIKPFESMLSEPIRNGIYKKKEFHGRGARVVNMGELFGFEFISNQEMKRVELNSQESENAVLADGDLLFARRSLILEGAGKCSLVLNPPELTTFESSIIRARPNKKLTDPRFLYYLFASPLGRAIMASIATRTAVSGIRGSDLSRLLLPLPPLQVQQRIAGILSAYDELIANSQQRIKTLESMARALYREWFVHFRFPGHESVSNISETLSDIPLEWEVKVLGDLCELRKDQFREEDHAGLPLLDMARMPSRSLAPSNTGSPDELKTSRILFQRGDTLFGAIRCYLHKVVAAHYSGVTNTSVLVLRPKSPSFRSIVAIVASDIDTIHWAEKQSTGTKMPVINWGVFQGMPSPIPSIAIAQAFEDIAGPMIDEIGILATKIQNLRRARDLLLPRLLSGQIDVEAIAS